MKEMNMKDKKGVLKRYRDLDRRIERDTEALIRLREQAMRVTPILSHVAGRSSSRENQLQLTVERILELEDIIADELERYIAMRSEIEQMIRGVKNETHTELLKRRYIDGDTWEMICEKMNYSYSHICRLHDKAVDELDIRCFESF